MPEREERGSLRVGVFGHGYDGGDDAGAEGMLRASTNQEPAGQRPATPATVKRWPDFVHGWYVQGNVYADDLSVS